MDFDILFFIANYSLLITFYLIMTLLVTGGAGFIGSNFIKYWLQKYDNDKVVNFDALTYASNLDNLLEVENDSRYKFVKGNICDKEKVDEVIRGVDLVVHFAAESHVDNSIKNPDIFVETNVLGTNVLLRSALEHKIKKFHHVSTDEVYGSLDLESEEKFLENTPYNPRSPYSASKAGSDHLVRSYFHTYSLPVTITNCSNNYGPGQHREKLIPKTILNILEGKKVPIYGDGKNVRDWLYVDDHCRAIDLVVQKGKIGETYLVGGMEGDVSNFDIIERIAKSMGKNIDDEVEFVEDRLGHDRRYAIDWSKIKNELDYEPEYSLDKYLEKTIEWYRDNLGNI